MALRVKSEADLPARVLEALRAQGELDATPEPVATHDVSPSTTARRDGWGFRRAALVTMAAYVGGSVALAATRAILG